MKINFLNISCQIILPIPPGFSLTNQFQLHEEVLRMLQNKAIIVEKLDATGFCEQSLYISKEKRGYPPGDQPVKPNHFSTVPIFQDRTDPSPEGFPHQM